MRVDVIPIDIRFALRSGSIAPGVMENFQEFHAVARIRIVVIFKVRSAKLRDSIPLVIAKNSSVLYSYNS
jgi:hypothetical protein